MQEISIAENIINAMMPEFFIFQTMTIVILTGLNVEDYKCVLVYSYNIINQQVVI